MTVVLDACAIIAYLRNEPGADVVESVFVENENTCIIHAVNLCEVYYDFLKAADEETAKDAIENIESIGIKIREDMDTQFWQEAGKYKAYNKISLGDAFALALTQREKATIVTSDHQEFDPLISKGISVKFFR